MYSQSAYDQQQRRYQHDVVERQQQQLPHPYQQQQQQNQPTRRSPPYPQRAAYQQSPPQRPHYAHPDGAAHASASTSYYHPSHDGPLGRQSGNGPSSSNGGSLSGAGPARMYDHDSATIYAAPMRYGDSPAQPMSEQQYPFHGTPSTALLPPLTGQQDSAVDYDTTMHGYLDTKEHVSRPVSSSASNIISLYANTDAGDSSYGTLSTRTDGYAPADTAWESSIDSPGYASNSGSIRRPLPQVPQGYPEDSAMRTKAPLPPVPIEEDASRFYSPVSIDGEGDPQRNYQRSSRGQAPSTPSIGEHSSTISSMYQPQTPPAWSPPASFRQQIPSRRGTPTNKEPALPPPPIGEQAEANAATMNRSKSIIGQTIVGPGAAALLPLPVEDLRRVRSPSAESFRDVISKPAQDKWDSHSGHLSPLTPVDIASSPHLTEESSDPSLLSNVALMLRDAVPRGTQIKGSVSYPYSFTGKDVVSTILTLITEDKLAWAARCVTMTGELADGRHIALCIAKSLKNQLFFHEVDWGVSELHDGVEEVYMFLDDSMGEQESTANDFDVELSRAANGNRLHRGQMTRANDLVDLPTGVFTPMTECYSPFCGRPNAPPNATCYSSSCPRSRRSRSTQDDEADLLLSSAVHATTLASSVGASHNAQAWADTVPADLLANLAKEEIKRQNAILELIQKEEEFLHDLELLTKLFLAKLLQSSAATDPQSELSNEKEREEFVREVFSNHTELTGHIRMLVERLHIRQREDGPVVGHVGDIYLNAALEWGGAFETNMTSFPLAKHRLQREASRNPHFASFLEECRRDPACHRLPMDHFLQRATTRLPRYNLHFKSIWKDTDESNADRQSLSRAIELVDEQCKSIQKGVAAAETKVKIREYAYNLATKRNKVAIHMDLLNPERQLVHQGRVYRKPDFTDFEWQDLLAVLFDNYLVVTKTKKREEGDRSISRFVLEKRPIAVEMMQLIGFTDPAVSRSLGLSNFHLRSDRENRDLYPFTIAHIAGKMEPLTLYVTSKAERDEWKAKIDEAIGLRSAVQEANKLFEIWPISSELFALSPPNSLDPEKPPPGISPSDFHGIVTCAVPFCTRDGRRLIAIGCADGVWIGLRNDAKSLRKVLHLKLVMQCAVLEAFGIFVVLADKVLISYSLDALVPSANSPTNPRPPQKLSGNRDVMFFAVGQVKERTLLVYMKKKPNESVFRALEPVAVGVRNDHHKSGSGTGGGLFGKFSKDNKSSDWFREFKTFFIPSEAYSMQFLRSKLCIVCARGFEIIDLDNLIPGTIPDFSLSSREDPRVYHLSRRVETVRPLGMFKNREGEFLLCYDGFACFVDRRGSPIKLEQVIEWEGVPHSVAFKEPFILAFDARFVEVRDSVSGQLVQLIRAQDLRNVTFSSGTISDEEEAIILVQRLRSPQRKTHDYQQVFDLIGTPIFQHHMRPLQAPFSAASDRPGPFHGASASGSSAWPNASYAGEGIATGAGPGSFFRERSASNSAMLQRQGTTATTATSWTSNSNSSSQGGMGSGRRAWI